MQPRPSSIEKDSCNKKKKKKAEILNKPYSTCPPIDLSFRMFRNHVQVHVHLYFLLLCKFMRPEGNFKKKVIVL